MCRLVRAVIAAVLVVAMVARAECGLSVAHNASTWQHVILANVSVPDDSANETSVWSTTCRSCAVFVHHSYVRAYLGRIGVSAQQSLGKAVIEVHASCEKAALDDGEPYSIVSAQHMTVAPSLLVGIATKLLLLRGSETISSDYFVVPTTNSTV